MLTILHMDLLHGRARLIKSKCLTTCKIKNYVLRHRITFSTESKRLRQSQNVFGKVVLTSPLTSPKTL
jgi:hypothetical protein